MDRGAWQATVCGVVRVRHDLVIKPPLQTLRSFKWNKGSFFSAQAPWESRDLVLQRCLEMLMLMVEHVTLSDTGSENQGGRGRETPFSVSLRIYSIFWTPYHQRILIFPVWGGEMCWRDLNIQFLDSYFEQLAAWTGVAGVVPGAALTCAQKGQRCPQGGLQGRWWISQLPRAWGPALLSAPRLWVYFLTQGSSCGLCPFGRLARCLLTPGFFPLEAALPPLRSAGVRGVRVPRLP